MQFSLRLSVVARAISAVLITALGASGQGAAGVVFATGFETGEAGPQAADTHVERLRFTMADEEALAGGRSLLGDSTASSETWNEFYHAPHGLLRAREGYTISFDYRILRRDDDAAFYALLRRRSRATQTRQWQDLEAPPGAVGTVRMDLFTEGVGDYGLIVGIRDRGAMAVDNVRISVNPDLRPQGTELPPVTRTWQSPGGTSYFLDADAGDDANDGSSPELAWRTFARVNQGQFAPGDRILLKAGCRWQGALTPGGCGTADAPIVVGRYGQGSPPRIDGEARYLATVYLHNTEYIEVADLEITNTGRRYELARRGVLVKIEDFGTAHHIRLRNLFVHNVNGRLRKKGGAGGAIHWQCGGKETPSRFDDLRIEGCLLKDCGRNGITAGGNWQRDSWYPSLNVVIRGNTLEGIPGDGIVPIACDGALVEHNVMRDCPRLLPDGDAAAGMWPWSCDNTVLQFNEVSDHKAPWDGQGFDADWNCRGTVIQYNYSHDNEGGFLLICNAGNSKPPYNIGNQDVIVRYNVSVNDGRRLTGRHAGFSPILHISGPCARSRIYSNTIVIGSRPEGADRDVIKMDNWGGPWPTDTLVANNLVVAAEPVTYDMGNARNTVFRGNVFLGEHRGLPDGDHVTGAVDLPRIGLPARPGIESLSVFRPRWNGPWTFAGRPVEEALPVDALGTAFPKERPGLVGALAPSEP